MTQLFIYNWKLNVTDMPWNKWPCFTETFTDKQKMKGGKNIFFCLLCIFFCIAQYLNKMHVKTPYKNFIPVEFVLESKMKENKMMPCLVQYAKHLCTLIYLFVNVNHLFHGRMAMSSLPLCMVVKIRWKVWDRKVTLAVSANRLHPYLQYIVVHLNLLLCKVPPSKTAGLWLKSRPGIKWIESQLTSTYAQTCDFLFSVYSFVLYHTAFRIWSSVKSML
jgi:hypothetical protein